MSTQHRDIQNRRFPAIKYSRSESPALGADGPAAGTSLPSRWLPGVPVELVSWLSARNVGEHKSNFTQNPFPIMDQRVLKQEVP